jgi:transcriptional regulator GlxA family with amidase domain
MASIERYLSVQEVAQALQLDPRTVRKHFRLYPDVLRIGVLRKVLRIPESALKRYRQKEAKEKGSA